MRGVWLAIILAACGGGHGAQPDANPNCGNSVVDPGEDCDDGASNGMPGDGCTTACRFECLDPVTDCGAAPACAIETCSDNHACQVMADPAQAGMVCGDGLVCFGGECISATCNDGIVQGTEQCDFGAGNGQGTGCEPDCKFSCTTSPDSCDDGNPCNGVESCGVVIVNGNTGQKCSSTAPQANGTPCGGGKVCIAQLCVAPACGDGFVESPEQCDDGMLNGTPTDGCTSSCTFVCVNPATDCGAPPPCETWTCTASHTCSAVADPAQDGMACGGGMVCRSGMCVSATATCGNGVREGSEQCDDGNTRNLDGCDANCKFEQVQRIISLATQFGTDSYCTKNALGGAVSGSTARNQLATAINNGIKDGSITIEFDALGLDDLTGTNDASLAFGMLGGAPASGTGYNGTSDLDWWYPTAPGSIDGTRTATTQMPASIAGMMVNAGPAEISITVNFAGVVVTMDMFGSHFRATTGASSAPTVSTGTTPGHLASEHDAPGLVSFATMTNGELCGNTTAASLASVQVPSVLVGCGISYCTQCYTSANTLLDVITNGCNTLLGTQIKATQPDTARIATDVYKFSSNASHVVVSCTKNGAPAMLSDCLANAAYTTFYKFGTDRVIAK